MYLQTSRLQYNLQKVGVFQTAHSDKLFKPKLVKLLYHRSTDNSSILLAKYTTCCTVVNDRLHFSQKNMMKTTLSKTLDVWRSRRRRETSKVGAGYITPR